MQAARLAGSLAVARHQGLQQVRQLGHAVLGAARRLHGRRAQQHDARVEQTQGGGQRLVAGPVEQLLVERVLGGDLLQRRAAREGALERLEGLLQGGELGFGGVFGEQLAGQAFQFLAHLVDAARLFGRQPLDHRAAVRNDDDQAFGFELAQRFAHQGAADAGHFAEFAFGQAFARAEPANQDGVADALGHAMAQYGSDTLDLEFTFWRCGRCHAVRIAKWERHPVRASAPDTIGRPAISSRRSCRASCARDRDRPGHRTRPAWRACSTPRRKDRYIAAALV
ncbi:Uncharacterised protein [Bordetella pertussis]|nr:Uncharacterised protein [Bordetella pertussis]